MTLPYAGGWIEIVDLPDPPDEVRTLVQEVVEFAKQVQSAARRDRELERQLRVQRERLELVLSSIGLGFWYIDLPFDRLNWDHQVRAHFGISPEEPVTIELFYERLHPEDREPVREAIQNALNEGASYDIEYRVVDGEVERWIRAIGAAFEGQPRRFDGITLDITRNKRIEEALRLAAEKALSESQVKSEFLANVSHEIRTPMVGILGILEFLARTDLDQEQKEYVNTLSQCADSLQRVVDDVLALSRLEAGKLELHAEPCDLHALLKSARDLFLARAREKNLDLRLELPPDLPVWIEADRARLLQILNNLLSNAVKFTEHGAVKLVPSVDSKGLLIEVRDTGIGIAGSDLERVFDPFTQVDASTSRIYGGTGLGLSIVKKLVELMGGRVSVSSRRGEGSVFSLRLPYSECLPGAGPRGHTAADRSTTPPTEKRVLVAEDNPVNGRVIALQIRRLGYLVNRVQDGAEAVDAVKEQDFDLVLMDCQMPGVDGYEATRRIRALGYGLPIIALTAHALEGEREKCLASGMNEYATKPLSIEALAELLRNWTEPLSS